MRRTLLACLALVLVDAACFGRFAFELGFYHDDWRFLELAAAAEGFAGSVASMSAETASRPTLGPFFAALTALCGSAPPAYQAALAALRILESVLLMLALRRLTGSRRLSFLAAAFAAAYPCRFGDRVWFSNAPQMAAQCLALGALSLHLDFLRAGGRGRAVLAQVLTVAAALTYESVLFLPVGAALPRLAARWKEGRGAGGALAATLRDFAPFLIPVAVYLGWRSVAPLLLGTPASKNAEVSAAWALQVYAKGAWCVVVQPALTAFQALPAALGGGLGLWAAAALAAGSRFGRGLGRGAGHGAWYAALGFFLGGYLPYALSGTYLPAATGVMSRVNGAAAWPFGLLLATAAARLGRPRAASAAALCALVLACGVTARDWVDSWRAQRRILAQARAHSGEFPKDAAVWLADAPVMVGGVLVFSAPWDFGPALRLDTGRKDLVGRVVSFQGGPAYEEAMALDLDRVRCFFSVSRDRVVCRPPGPG